ncbi:hypothetical protein L916_12915 [Phytophthora nicotianae]|uniref:Uncharacterized protein n=1 Tax=Phytophthora nicotianae TaxID=4792 RepID=W2ILD3_PHYNI|nr:hypothetical protein L916_12915 [Phytophthora nicotianae]
MATAPLSVGNGDPLSRFAARTVLETNDPARSMKTAACRPPAGLWQLPPLLAHVLISITLLLLPWNKGFAFLCSFTFC